MLGLTISSITRFAAELGNDNIMQKHVERTRTRTIGRAVANSEELHERERVTGDLVPRISAPFNPEDRNMSLRIVDNKETKVRLCSRHEMIS